MTPLTRLVTPADADQIAAIYAPIVTSTIITFEEVPPDATEIRARVAAYTATHPWLVAEDGEGILGYAYGSPHRPRAGYRWSVDVSVYLHERARGRGVGRALYLRLLPLLTQQGFHRAYAGIGLPNDASVGLHRAMGFEPIATYREVGWKLGLWVDTVWLERALAPATTPAEPIPVGALPRELLEPEPLEVRP
ncbi:MAG TPA: arsinothricin resistance N-acetyltransferase ArsN1 family B [Candidatus Elarobacter sp.]|jgi:phosphinothricin acetyltransferase